MNEPQRIFEQCNNLEYQVFCFWWSIQKFGNYKTAISNFKVYVDLKLYTINKIINEYVFIVTNFCTSIPVFEMKYGYSVSTFTK